MTKNLSLQSLRTVSDRTMRVKLTVDKIAEDEVDLRYFDPVIDIGQLHRSNIMAKSFDFDIESVTCFSIGSREIFHETSQQRH